MSNLSLIITGFFLALSASSFAEATQYEPKYNIEATDQDIFIDPSKPNPSPKKPESELEEEKRQSVVKRIVCVKKERLFLCHAELKNKISKKDYILKCKDDFENLTKHESAVKSDGKTCTVSPGPKNSGLHKVLFNVYGATIFSKPWTATFSEDGLLKALSEDPDPPPAATW